MHAEHSIVELGVVTSAVSFSLERQTREADVGSQSADTIKLSFRTSCFEMASDPIRPVPYSDRSKETAPAPGES